MTIWLWTGGRPSDSAKAICEAPGFKRMISGKSFKSKTDTVVGWGAKSFPPCNLDGAEYLNDPASITSASNKLLAFQLMAGNNIQTSPWTANQEVAKEWQVDGATVVARKILTGHSGNGIIVIEKGQPLVEAPLYTKYVFKIREYRVHATKTEVIDTQQKVCKPGEEPKTWKIRVHSNGFMFQRNNIAVSPERDALAIAAINTLGLDFGAVDIIEDKKGNLYVLEVNTAPGLEGQTVNSYVKALTDAAAA